MGQREFPIDRGEPVGAARLEQRRPQPAQLLHLPPRQLGQVIDGVLEDCRGNGGLNVGRLRLHALVADRRELIEFIGHAPALSAHAIGAGLAGILGRQRLGGLAHAHPADGGQGVENLLGSPAHDLLAVSHEPAPFWFIVGA